MADWYYARDGQQQGPITSAQLRQMAAAGQLQPDDLVFREGSKDWVAASTVAGLFPAAGGARGGSGKPTSGDAFAFDEPANDRGGASRGRDRDRDKDDRERDRDRDRDRERERAGRGRGRDDRDDDDDDDRGGRSRSSSSSGGSSAFVDFLLFRRMIAPFLIMLQFWLGILGIGIGGLIAAVFMLQLSAMTAIGVLLSIPFAMLFWRVYCEILIIFFRMNETLREIKELQKAKQP